MAGSTALAEGRISVLDGTLEVAVCDEAKRSGQEIRLSPYGSSIPTIGSDCSITGVAILDGPINTWSPRVGGGGMAIVHGRPIVYGADGKLVLDGAKVRDHLLSLAANDPAFNRTWFHHEIIETAWDTYMALALQQRRDGASDDIIVEFDHGGDVLATVSLNTLILGDRWGAKGLGRPFGPEDWLHTNSLDTRADGTVLVSTRNINTIQLIDWASKKRTREIGGPSVLSLQHFARFVPGGLIRVYDNGAASQQSSVVDFKEDGTLVRRLPLPFYAGAYGSVHELANGNWLTINGTTGEVYELSPDASEVYMRVKYNVGEYIPWLKSNRPILYRAYPAVH